ncbi:formylglycine-generating enzyme family protein [Roseomonas sp. NAR14]|uniref:Formylglycine-generating enzyme family protein n=1 Tax=Roseomonas acroporae TaxID=2937791 RepID=A0A9X1Y819_9PROT|nr:formylglycine-generating enzyme family protein [Roseomonas acroporae]MCK8784807.1 formylglycine-generating enzyme family protein [Roseomonas acroporae]
MAAPARSIPKAVAIPEAVAIPPGRFRMGSPDDEPGHEDSESPVREVAIRAFALGRTPVTFAQWDAFADATGGWRPPDEGWGRGGRPVVNVSWHDARAYCAWLADRTGQPWRLPGEAEWEYAARAGTGTPWYWGASFEPGRAHCFAPGCALGGERTVPVGQFPPNAFGLHDMLGNVWEWVEDCWNEFHLGAPPDGTPRLEGDCGRRVLRGGSWLDVPRQIRCAARNRNGRDFRCDDYGFRVAHDT